MRITSHLILPAVVALAAISPMSTAQARSSAITTLEGKVIHVEDGDTVTLIDNRHTQHTIRLADIDAPETCHRQRDPSCSRKPGQPFGDAARTALSAWLKGQQVTATCRGVVHPGRDEREVCYIHIGAASGIGQSVNYRLVSDGLAWVEPRFARDPRLIAIGNEARSKRVGLWAKPNPVEPREWRSMCWTNGHCPQ